MRHIEFTDEDLRGAEPYLHENRVQGIQFSLGTYQLQLKGLKGEEIWCFIQLDHEGLITDCFCSCESDHETCEHLAASWLQIYNGHLHPLHVRFSRSLWNQICRIYLRKLGDDLNVLKQVAEGYECFSHGGKPIFTLKLKAETSRSRFLGIIKGRVRETEETSLKFSKLPSEELRLWREGRPSFELRYELSFWSDLAKWIMEIQEEGEPYEILFSYTDTGLPNGIQVSFPQFEFYSYISEADLPLIIPSLATVRSPLKVHIFDEEAIDYIVYDQNNVSFEVHGRPGRTLEDSLEINGRLNLLKNAHPIEDWLYIQGDGFYAKEQNFLLSNRHIPASLIGQILEEHGKLVERYLLNVKIFREPLKVSYQLQFDNLNNLHLCCYAKTAGDLQQEGSAFFGKWAYLANDGFYPLEGVLFEQIETIVASDKLSDFISQNRIWLNTQEGYHTHLATVDSHLTYRLDEFETLRFFSKTDLIDQMPLSKDLGDWIYVAEEGFYAKRHGRIGQGVQPGVEVKKQDIAFFIRMYEEELDHVKGFFSLRSPVLKAGVKIKLQTDMTVLVTPFYHLHKDYKEENVRFFENVVYVEGEGFHLLPPEKRLPNRFCVETLVTQDQLPFFISHELKVLEPFAAEIDKALCVPKELFLELREIHRVEEGKLSADIAYKSEWGSIFLDEIYGAIKKGHRFLFSKNGLIDLEDPKLQWLRGCSSLNFTSSGHILLSTMEMLRLQASQDISLHFSNQSDSEVSQALWNSLCDFTAPLPPNYTSLKSTLRPYQEVGLKWLWFLYYHGLAGLLCDEMGLGKTHQTMALMAAISHKKGERPRFIIVCPTSVIYHWEDKLNQFLPNLSILTFYGSSRTLEGFYEKYDILLTSFGVLRVEHEEIGKLNFDLAVFDEVQVAKNHLSVTHKALLAIHAKMRLGLTGTPIENRLRELKALFDLVLPSYMPSESQYREQFVLPIEKYSDVSAQRKLSRLIRPFILRRKKTDVLRELPEKTEELAYCVLSEDQQKSYQAAIDAAKDGVLSELKDDAKPIPFLPLFALLTKLKQVCDHPAVALATPKEYKKYQSGKWDLFLELLEEARESQQKVVVFSHYLSMMDIIEDYLSEQKIGFAAVRGATQNRREELKRFQEDPTCEVFVGSLQAVGLGVDLTAASVVIHYDRWWNAARENQATDRVHRIGQQRGVQVFKLVTKNTLEEHIDRLIMKKGQLMEEIVGSDDENQLKLLTKKEWLELLNLL